MSRPKEMTVIYPAVNIPGQRIENYRYIRYIRNKIFTWLRCIRPYSYPSFLFRNNNRTSECEASEYLSYWATGWLDRLFKKERERENCTRLYFSERFNRFRTWTQKRYNFAIFPVPLVIDFISIV